VILQGARTASAIVPGRDAVQLGELLALPDEQLDHAGELWLADKQLVTYRVLNRDRLCFPSSGIFALPVLDPKALGGVGFETATPLDQRTFLALMSPTASFAEFERQASRGQYFAGLSVGLDARRVVIPPDLHHRGDEKLRTVVPHWRQCLVTHVRKLTQVREHAEVAQAFGGSLDHSEAFRRARERHEASGRETA